MENKITFKLIKNAKGITINNIPTKTIPSAQELVNGAWKSLKARGVLK